jgi:hypothetical protein
MAFLLFIQWWYGQGWINAFSRVGQRMKIISQELSLPILVKTLFEPWKQIISYAGNGSSLEQKFRAWFDNVFARIIGFIIRLFTIIFGLTATMLVGAFGLILALFWPFVPLLPFVLLIVSFI